jgi:hypothetical protein
VVCRGGLETVSEKRMVSLDCETWSGARLATEARRDKQTADSCPW